VEEEGPAPTSSTAVAASRAAREQGSPDAMALMWRGLGLAQRAGLSVTSAPQWRVR